MSDRETVEAFVRSAYDARGREDLDAVMAAFADDAVFELNGRGTGAPALAAPCRGKDAVRSLMSNFMRDMKWRDWRILSLLIDGDEVAVHWRGRVLYAPTGKAEEFNVLDLIKLQNGKIGSFYQCADTALLMSITAA